MEYFVQQLINGLTLGAIYALIAIGYTMVYGIIGMINFAHGEIYMIGAFLAVITFTGLGMLGLTWAPAAILVVLVVSMFFTAAYGWAVERIAYRPLRGSHRLAPLISAIGMCRSPRARRSSRCNRWCRGRYLSWNRLPASRSRSAICNC